MTTPNPTLPSTPKLKPEVKQKWLQALRSGSYKQGKHVLRTADNHYCCLGVLCDVVAPELWETPKLETVYTSSETLQLVQNTVEAFPHNGTFPFPSDGIFDAILADEFKNVSQTTPFRIREV